MDRVNRNEFLSNTSEVMTGLEKALRELADKKAIATNRFNELRSNRESALHSYAEKLLPDLEQETLHNLRTLLPEFVTNSVTNIFDEANMIHAPFLTRLLGNQAVYRIHELSSEFYMLRTHLAAAIDKLDPKPRQFNDISKIDAEFMQLQDKIKIIVQQEDHIESQLAALKQAHGALSHNQDINIPRNLAKAVHESATKLREQPQSATHSDSDHDHDDYSDVLMFWASGIPTSIRTYGLYAIEGHDSHINTAEEFIPGGGQMGGGGATGTWENSTQTGGQDDPAVVMPVNVTPEGNIS